MRHRQSLSILLILEETRKATMFEHEKEEQSDLLLADLLEAMDKEITAFRRLKERISEAGEISTEPREDSSLPSK